MSLNKAMLIGHVGNDPDVHYIDSGMCTARFNLATSVPGYSLPNGTQVPERTEWHRIQLWGRLAEIAERYVKKGDKLYIEGQIRTRSYTDRQKITRYVTEIWGENMEMLTPRQQQTQAGSPSNPFPPSSTTKTAAEKKENKATPPSDLTQCPF